MPRSSIFRRSHTTPTSSAIPPAPGTFYYDLDSHCFVGTNPRSDPTPSDFVFGTAPQKNSSSSFTSSSISSGERATPTTTASAPISTSFPPFGSSSSPSTPSTPSKLAGSSASSLMQTNTTSILSFIFGTTVGARADATATQTSAPPVMASANDGTTSNVSTTVFTAPAPELPSEITKKVFQEPNSPTQDEIVGYLKSLEDLVAAATPATAAATTTETVTNETKSIVESFLGKDYDCLTDDYQRMKLRSGLNDLIKDKFFPPGVGPIIQGMLDQLESGVSAFYEARTQCSDEQVLAGKIETSVDALQSKINACNMKFRKIEELEKEKQRIEAEQAQVFAEIEGIVEDSHPLQAQLQHFIQRRAIFAEKNGDYKAVIDMEEELWGSFKKMLHKYFSV